MAFKQVPNKVPPRYLSMTGTHVQPVRDLAANCIPLTEDKSGSLTLRLHFSLRSGRIFCFWDYPGSHRPRDRCQLTRSLLVSVDALAFRISGLCHQIQAKSITVGIGIMTFSLSEL